MIENNKIRVSLFLKELNFNVDQAIKYGHVKKDYVVKLNCNDLALKVGVTPATISNLTTSSKFYLLYRIAEEILDSYFAYFSYDELFNKKEYPDELIAPRDKSYVLMLLTTYYTDEWLGN